MEEIRESAFIHQELTELGKKFNEKYKGKFIVVVGVKKIAGRDDIMYALILNKEETDMHSIKEYIKEDTTEGLVAKIASTNWEVFKVLMNTVDNDL